jgi:SAM-dependent methyltransferase
MATVSPLAAQVRTRHGLDKRTPISSATWSALAGDAGYLQLLTDSVNLDLGVERTSTELRRACLLGRDDVTSGQLPLLAALAMQAWHNEYIWDETPDETTALRALRDRITAGVDSDLQSVLLPLFQWAMYRPLGDIPAVAASAGRPLKSVPPVLYSLWRQTLLAPLEERGLRSTMPSEGPIRDDTSRAVRRQYEENPFPRWQRLPAARRSVLERSRAYDPAFAWPDTFRPALQMLVAGCGTGRQPLALAAANGDAEVLAVDLSTASLAYAQRMARELSVPNVRFLQADLLNLPAMGRLFHHIECVGVLHHVRDQQAAWRAVADVLHRDGTMTVGVYSKVARLLVTHLRDRIAREGLPATPAAVRAFRTRLLRESEGSPALAPLLRTSAFFSLSDFRDLLFNVHEHHYTIAEIEERARECRLRLLGFHIPARLRATIGASAGRTFTEWRQVEPRYAGSLEMFSCTFVKE